MDPIKEKLIDGIRRLHEQLERSYEGRERDVLNEIANCREGLRGEEGNLGEWEQRELDYALAAANHGFLRLALVCARKAIIVSELPRDEYYHGLNYGRQPEG